MAEAPQARTLVFLVGPPAVGKMTVGYELAVRTGLKLLHNQRDVAASRQRLLRTDATRRLSSAGRFDGRADYLRIDNTSLPAADVAERIIAHFSLPRPG
jgi:broad-specificity NMP kinase